MPSKSIRSRERKLPVLNTAHLAALNLFRANNLLSRAITKHLSQFGLTISQHSVLALLRANGEQGLALSEVGELLSLSSPNITNVVDRLEEKGWVRRTLHGRDRRVKIIQLTEQGEELEGRVFELHGTRLEEMLGAHLNEKDQQELIRLLRLLRQSLEASEWLSG